MCSGEAWTQARERIRADIASRPAIGIGDRVKRRSDSRATFTGMGVVLSLFSNGAIARVRLDERVRRGGKWENVVIDVGVTALELV